MRAVTWARLMLLKEDRQKIKYSASESGRDGAALWDMMAIHGLKDVPWPPCGLLCRSAAKFSGSHGP